MISDTLTAMFQRAVLLQRVVLGIALITVGGCAGSKGPQGSFSPEDAGESLVRDMPKEFRDRFALEDAVPSPSPSPDATQAQSVGVALKASAKTKSKAAPKTKKTVAFKYPDRRPAINPVWVGERQTLEITYFGMAAGDLNIEVLPFKTINTRKVYHIKGNAQSSKIFSLIYRLNDTIQSFIDYEGWFSHRFHLVLDETKQQRDALELYDSEKKKTHYWDRWNHVNRGFEEKKETMDMPPFPQDSASALYYVRTLPLKVGDVYRFPVISEGKTWEAEVSVVRTEYMNTPLGRIETVVVKPETKFQGVLQKRGDSFIWYSNDDRRFIVRVEAKVKIGTVVARLIKVERGTPPES